MQDAENIENWPWANQTRVLFRRRIVNILETVIQERYADLEGHRGRQDYLQFVLNDTPGFPQAMSLHFLTILFAAHINTVSSVRFPVVFDSSI